MDLSRILEDVEVGDKEKNITGVDKQKFETLKLGSEQHRQNNRDLKEDDIDTTRDDENNKKNKAYANASKEMMKMTRAYFKVVGDYLGAVLNMYEQKYRDNMKILRIHVRDYVGEEATKKKND